MRGGWPRFCSLEDWHSTFPVFIIAYDRPSLHPLSRRCNWRIGVSWSWCSTFCFWWSSHVPLVLSIGWVYWSGTCLVP